MGRQRGALEVGQDPADRVSPTGMDGRPKRAFRPDDDRTGDEKLGNVNVERRLRGAEKLTSIGPSSTTRTLLALSRPCEMPASCRRATSLQSCSSNSSLT